MHPTPCRRSLSGLLLALAAGTGLAGPGDNVATLTVADGPDAGTYTISGGPRSCVLKPRPDGQPGVAFVGSFDRSTGGRVASGTRGPMEASAAFYVGPSGTTDQFTVVASFAVEKALEMRAYEVETRPTSGRKLRGRGTARLAREGRTASAKVEAVTEAGVKVSLAISCGSVSER